MVWVRPIGHVVAGHSYPFLVVAFPPRSPKADWADES